MPFIGWDSAASDEQYLNANREALRWCVRHGISIVHMVRNPLDVLISRQKHYAQKGLTSHCKTSECTEKHLHSKPLLSEKNTVSDLKQSIRYNEQISQVLHGVKDLIFFTVSYEDTFGVHGDHRMVKTWTSLLHFLGKVNGTCFRPEQKLDIEKIRSAMPYMSTSAVNQSDKVINFSAIEKALRGAGLGEMVH